MVNMTNRIFKTKEEVKQTRTRNGGLRINKYTLSDAAQFWMQSQKVRWKPGTYAVYNQLLTKYILPYWGNIRLNKISPKTMDNFVVYLTTQPQGNQLSRNYISQICAVVRRILLYMNQKYYCDIFVPCNPVGKGRTQSILLPSDDSLILLERYLSEHCEEDTCLGILIAFHTGIRIGELSALTWKDINIEEKMIYIRKNIIRIKEKTSVSESGGKATQIIKQSPKTSDSVRAIPIPSKLLHPLQKYKKEDSIYVVSGVKKPWAEPRTIQYRFKSILKKCNIEYFNFHMLRHSFATRCVSMGLDVKSLSEILGHSNIQITLNLYVHSTIQQKKLLMKQYDSFFS